jgi:hypothetical protein
MTNDSIRLGATAAALAKGEVANSSLVSRSKIQRLTDLRRWLYRLPAALPSPL